MELAFSIELQHKGTETLDIYSKLTSPVTTNFKQFPPFSVLINAMAAHIDAGLLLTDY
jgi:hypothetical protein